jgi:hypothetical protein
MPRDKDLKRLVRTRMKKTGEAYTTARAQLLEKSRKKQTKATPAHEPAPAATQDYAALAGMSDASVKEKTGRDWVQWVRTLNGEGGAKLSHRERAAIINEKYHVDGWWSQMVTVGYERIKGLRATGQRLDGTYEASKSRTFNVPVDTLYNAWADPSLRKHWLTGANVNVRSASSPKSMRIGWDDGSVVAVWFTVKSASKSVVAVAHSKLPDKQTAEDRKRYWSDRFDALGNLLSNH